MYQIVLHIFGDKDSPCCTNYDLKKTGRGNFDCYNLSEIESLLISFYMDNFLKLFPSKEQAKQLCQEMIEIMAAGGFNLTKVNNKSPDVLGSLPDDKHEKSINHLEIDKE